MKEVFRLLLTASAIAVFSTLSFAAGPSVTPAYHEPSTLVHTRMQPAGASCEAVATSFDTRHPASYHHAAIRRNLYGDASTSNTRANDRPIRCLCVSMLAIEPECAWKRELLR